MQAQNYNTQSDYRGSEETPLMIPFAPGCVPMRGGLDSSTAAVLSRAGLLRTFCSAWDLVTTEIVYEEIGRGPDAPLISAILNEYCTIERVSGQGLFGRGENSVLTLYTRGQTKIVFSDDGPFLKYCRKKNIPYYSSIMVPFLMCRLQVLPRDDALRYTAIITDKGRFSNWVIEYVREIWE